MNCVIKTPMGFIEIIEENGAITGIHHRESATLLSPSTPVLKEAAKQLNEYFDGNRTVFDLPLAITESPFVAAVLTALPTLVPYGHTASYGQVAAMMGSPGCARVVGTAMRRNPFVIVVPCHRIVRSGDIGRYSAGGVENKRLLLNLEGAIIG